VDKPVEGKWDNPVNGWLISLWISGLVFWARALFTIYPYVIPNLFTPIFLEKSLISL